MAINDYITEVYCPINCEFSCPYKGIYYSMEKSKSFKSFFKKKFVKSTSIELGPPQKLTYLMWQLGLQQTVS
jgi:hypothetical protein